MDKYGHTGLNLTIASLTTLLIPLGYPNLTIAGTIILVATATLPDIDLKLPFVTHRGITHTVWFAALTGLLTGGVTTDLLTFPEVTAFTIGFIFGFTGIIGHLTGDVMTPSGIKPFSPLNHNHYTFNLFTADNKLANSISFMSGGIILFAAYHFIA